MRRLLKSVFLWYYCLPISAAVAMMVLATLVWFLVRKHLGKPKGWKLAAGIILIIWMGAMVYSTIASRESVGTQHVFVPLYSYWAVLHGANPEILRSNFMNVMLFYPAGLLCVALLPEKWPRRKRILLVLVLFAAVSASVEYVQYTCGLGWAECDDVLHNSLGAFAGAWIGSLYDGK